MNSGIKSLVLAAGKHGVNLSVDRLVHDHELDESELDLSGLVGIANKNSLKAKSIRADREAIRQLDTALPVIAQLDNGHYVVIAGYLDAEPEGESGSIQFIDPLAVKPRVEEIDLNRFLQRWNGHLVLLKSNYSLADDDQPLSRRWIVQALSKQKLLMAQLVAISLLLHIFGFLPIIYIMTVLDKVVNYEAYSTLYVIASGIIVAHIFNAVFGYMRRYIALFVTSKIEVRLNSWVFSHMLDLPLDYFHNNDSSRVVKTVQQVATIRQFLVNKLFGTVLDSTALLIFIPILILYSPLLFSIVFVFALLIAFNNAFFSRRQKEVMQTVNAQETQKQSTLLHSVSGIEMVKSLTLETAQKRKWDEYAASHTLANMELGKVNAASSQIGSMLQQIMTVVVIFVGVLLVFDGELSPGVLIGVNMLAGKITGPLVALATMSAETEKLSMAISMLSSITDRKGEYRRAGLVPEIKGGIEFQGVGFSYKEDQQLL